MAFFHDPPFSHFGSVPACDGQTDGQTDRRTHEDSIYRANIASRGRKLIHSIRYARVASESQFDTGPFGSG